MKQILYLTNSLLIFCVIEFATFFWYLTEKKYTFNETKSITTQFLYYFQKHKNTIILQVFVTKGASKCHQRSHSEL